jgi:hypothetical protein
MHVFVTDRGPAKILAYAAVGAAATALLCAALNLIGLAGYLFAGAVAFLALGLILLLYLRLPEPDRATVLSRQVIRRASVVSMTSAIAVSCGYWYATWWLPLDYVPPAMQGFLADHWRTVDLIPALFAQLLPTSWQSGFHQYFRGGLTYCFPGPYWWESMRYLRAAIPGYSVVFFLGILLVRLGRCSLARWRPRRAT